MTNPGTNKLQVLTTKEKEILSLFEISKEGTLVVKGDLDSSFKVSLTFGLMGVVK